MHRHSFNGVSSRIYGMIIMNFLKDLKLICVSKRYVSRHLAVFIEHTALHVLPIANMRLTRASIFVA